jgi:transcriptional regulator with XRE-family HTH domain
METNFLLDLKAARRKAGLSQPDCAHLMGCSRNVISQLEGGRRIPTIYEICALSLIYGRSFESLFGQVFADVRRRTAKNLETLPWSGQDTLDRFNRQKTLDALAERLTVEADMENGG